MKTTHKLNSLERLSDVEKGRILHQLFPAEITFLIEYIIEACITLEQEEGKKHKNEAQYIKLLKQARNVKEYIAFYLAAIMTSSHVFADVLFHPDRAEFTIGRLHEYKHKISKRNNKFPNAIALLFDSFTGSSYVLTDEDYDAPEYILHTEESEDTWICMCGNMAEDEGFYPCNEQGNEVEPVKGEWDNLYVCMGCGRFFNEDDMKVIGINPNPIRIDLNSNNLIDN